MMTEPTIPDGAAEAARAVGAQALADAAVDAAMLNDPTGTGPTKADPSPALVLTSADRGMVRRLHRLLSDAEVVGQHSPAEVGACAAALCTPDGQLWAQRMLRPEPTEGPAQLALVRTDDGRAYDLACPTCGRSTGLRYREDYDTERTIDGVEVDPEPEPANSWEHVPAPKGCLRINGDFDWGDGNGTPGLVCIDCDDQRQLYLPPGWEETFV